MIAILLQRYPLCATLLLKKMFTSNFSSLWEFIVYFILHLNNIWDSNGRETFKRRKFSLCPNSSIFPCMCISERVQMSSYLVVGSFTSVRTVGSHFLYVISANEVAQCCWICQNYCCEYFLHLILNLGWLHPIQLFLHNICKY